MNLSRDKQAGVLTSRIAGHRPVDGPVKVDGVWGSYAPILAMHLNTVLKRPVLYVTPHIDDADAAADDMAVVRRGGVEVLSVWEDADAAADATDEIGAQRLRLVLGLAGGRMDAGTIICAGVQALNQPVSRPEALVEAGLSMRHGQVIEPELVVQWLVDNGFERVDQVDVPGQFARRGGIIDIFASVTTEAAGGGGVPAPVRVEFFGDTIESIRRVDLDSQRSSERIEQVTAAPTMSFERLDETELFVNLLSDDTIVMLDEPAQCQEVSEVFLQRVEDARGLYPWEAIYRAMQRLTVVEVSRFGAGRNAIHMGVGSAQEFEHKPGAVFKTHQAVLEELIDAARQREVILYCENAGQVKRVREIVEETHKGLPANLHLEIGYLRQGFVLEQTGTIVVSHHEVFGQAAVRRRVRSIRAAAPVESVLDLGRGDYVVHVSYGIGKFLGIQQLTRNETTEEYLIIEYAGGVKLNVPARNIALVQKYVGAMPKRPQLSKIGTKKWEKQKEKVAEGVQELAAELLDIQARREQMGGVAFGEDTVWQREFEESFAYQETLDQLTAAEEIKGDMKRAVPMDRLLCGDVGYGKTELAMRAAFKAVEGGKQVAMLVPTTVLCEQHGRTFAERFADFPVRIGLVNRFVTAKEAKEILSACRRGQVDVLIGTHRLLSEDVGFKDLGLLIIDEEQRFGVEHKERLKRFRVNVDVLTMTATPIPRTLHLSLLGLRDISSLTTPPLDRRSIVTKVCRYDKDTIRRAVYHELNRQGQVYFLHNRVQTIERAAATLREIIGDESVRIDIAHGQMHKHELEDAMIRFVRGQTDVLVCSTIIESGLDIPNANTMIINDADRFGLAQLHQLRGRVGRYKYRAYAYMLLPVTRTITPVAARRLKAIEEYSQLGSGFRIALRDLEIRGAGNILGPEQSGHINTVGYELYCQLLSRAVRKMRDEPPEEEVTTVVDLGFSTYIPKRYIPSDRQRMNVYRRIAGVRTEADMRRLCEELTDLFGPVPGEVQMLLDLSEVRMYAARWGVRSLVVQGPDLVFTFENPEGTADLFARAPGSVRIPNPRTVHVRLEKAYFEPLTLLSILRKMLRRPAPNVL